MLDFCKVIVYIGSRMLFPYGNLWVFLGGILNYGKENKWNSNSCRRSCKDRNWWHWPLRQGKSAKKAADETKATAKKAPAKKTTAKAEKVVETYVEFAGNQVLLANVEASVKAAYVAEGHRESSIKTMKVYVKPEENAAYYVINDNNVGRVDLFA